MQKNPFLLPLVSLYLLLGVASCNSKKDSPAPDPATNPVAAFEGATEIPKDSTRTFTNTSTHAQSFAWSIKPASGASIANPEAKDAVIAFTQSGNYEIILEAKSAGRPSSSIKKTVLVTTNPVADFSFTFSDINIVPAKVKLSTAGSENASTFEWTIENGPAVSGNPANPDSVDFTTPGDYVVRLVAIKDGKRSTPKEKTISILSGPEFTSAKEANFSPVKNPLPILLQLRQTSTVFSGVLKKPTFHFSRR